MRISLWGFFFLSRRLAQKRGLALAGLDGNPGTRIQEKRRSGGAGCSATSGMSTGVKDGSSQRPAREFMESLKFPRQGKDFHQTGGPDGSRQPHSHSLPPAGSESELNAGGRSRVTSVLIVLDFAAGASGRRRGAPVPPGSRPLTPPGPPGKVGTPVKGQRGEKLSFL